MRHTVEDMRRHAENCKKLIEGTNKPEVKARLESLAESWEKMADTKDWLEKRKHVHG
ncbi:hypothetical protein [Rhodoplanes sp. Z2-YC6860]|uniref:hypothetical protein n=1 Tax=Rhodoplanes sp. Z2-YC6860 TaxID=674703 RepID=UPI0012EDF419|nr:hypothetical protein [Rhodoplanes sp. Z2-YC6860]